MELLEGHSQDAAAMSRLAKGDESALSELMLRHAERLFHYLLRSLQNEAEANDLAQEAFVKVYQHRLSFDSKSKFVTWLYSIASNLVRDRYRWRVRHPQVSLDVADGPTGQSFRDSLPDAEPLPSETLQLLERAEAVKLAVASLPEELREALLLSEYEDYSHAQIGEILGCTSKSVEMRIHRARGVLRTRLAQWLGSVGS